MAGLLYIRCLMLTNNFESAEKFLDNIQIIQILPYEGAKDAHNYYAQTKLHLVLKYLKKRNYQLALQKVKEAREWPESLGVGAPYAGATKNTLEDEIQKLINKTQKGQKLSDADIGNLLNRINLSNM